MDTLTIKSIIGKVKFTRKKPTKSHYAAIWENMLGTIFAASIKKDVRFFDYDYDGAFIHSKIQTATDIRIAKYDGRPLGIPASARPKIGQTVIWAKHPKP